MRDTYKLTGERESIAKAASALGQLGRGDTRVYDAAGKEAIVTTNCNPEDVESVLVSTGVNVLKFAKPEDGISALEAELTKAQHTIRELIKEKHRQGTENDSLKRGIAEKVRLGERQSRQHLDAMLEKIAGLYGVEKTDVTRADANALNAYFARIESAAQKKEAGKTAEHGQLKAELDDFKRAYEASRNAKPVPRSGIADHTLTYLLGIPKAQREVVTTMLESYDVTVASVGGRGMCTNDATDLSAKLPDVVDAVFAHLKLRLTDDQREQYVNKVIAYLAGEGEWNSTVWAKDKKVSVQDVAVAYDKSPSWAAQQIKEGGLSKKSGAYTWGEIAHVFREE